MSSTTPTNTSIPAVTLDALLRARLVVGRLGEADNWAWWRTEGLLGPEGAYVAGRVLPRTHATTRARTVFAVAAQACIDRHPDRAALSLFRLDPLVEDQLDALLHARLGDGAWWEGQMALLEGLTAQAPLTEALVRSGVVLHEHLAVVQALALGPAGRSLPLKRATSLLEDISLLAAGFCRAGRGELVVPYLSGRGAGA